MTFGGRGGTFQTAHFRTAPGMPKVVITSADITALGNKLAPLGRQVMLNRAAAVFRTT